MTFSCYHFIIPSRWITLSSLATFYGYAPIFKAAVSLKILRTAHGRLSGDNFNHIISFGSPFLEFCPKFHTHASLHTLRTSWMGHTTQTLLFIREHCVRPNGWSEVSLILTSINMTIHAQKSPLQCNRKVRFDQFSCTHTYMCNIYIYIYTQGVTGGTDQTSGGCSLC